MGDTLILKASVYFTRLFKPCCKLKNKFFGDTVCSREQILFYLIAVLQTFFILLIIFINAYLKYRTFSTYQKENNSLYCLQLIVLHVLAALFGTRLF